MRPAFSTALVTTALLNLWALPVGPLAQEPQEPQGGRADAVAASGGTAAPAAEEPASTSPAAKEPAADVRAAGAGSVTIKDFSFAPKSVSVSVGDTVTWVNRGPTDHTATASDGSFDTGTLKKGQSGSHTFTRAGSFAYICSIHPNMRGTVVVAAAPGSPSSGSGAGGSGSSSGASPGSPSSAAPSSGTTAAAKPGLPATGVDVTWLLVSGALLLGAGVLLRRSVVDRT